MPKDGRVDASEGIGPSVGPPLHAGKPPGHNLSSSAKHCAHLIQQLRVAASVEHALMVQYLFAAYSLGGEHLKNDGDREMVAGWKILILNVAKEEMGHLLTVQNVLCLLGAEPDFGRESLLPFKLERLTIDSLIQYIWVEMPDGNSEPLDEVELILGKQRFERLKQKKSGDMNARHVGRLYNDIIKLIKDPRSIPDDCFHHQNFRLQASWDDWGRSYNYKAPASKFGDWLSKNQNFASDPSRMSAAQLELAPIIEGYKDALSRADVIVDRAATRSEAVAALSRVAEQGESSRKKDGSHLIRFAMILREWDDALQRNPAGWEPSYGLPDDPHTIVPDYIGSGSPIEWPLSKQWATLFNLRYRMLLIYLSHSFYLPAEGTMAQVRGAVIHKAFGEMYNLKAIANILVRLPLRSLDDPDRAGPPFEIPASLALPNTPGERWCLHRRLIKDALQQYGDLIEKTRELSTQLKALRLEPQEHLSYLGIAQEIDDKSAKWLDSMIGSTSKPQTMYAP